MNGRLATFTASQGGVFTRAQALTCGYDDAELHTMVRRRVWHRIRRGAYIDRSEYESLDRVGRHRMLANAVTLSMGSRVVISHMSAAVLHGFADWGLDLSRLHVTRIDGGAGRVETDLHHHVGGGADIDVVTVDGLRLVSPVRAVLETACVSPIEAGLVVADHALRSGKVSPGQLRAVVDDSRTWPGARNAGRIVGESRTRLLMYEEGLPTPVLQQDIHVGGRLVGRVDFCFPEYGVIVEFDGKVKYGGFGSDPIEVLFREKQREDLLRELGYEVVRIIWADLEHRAKTAERIRRAFDRAVRRPSLTR